MREIKFEYRILILTNGLGDINYIPEVRRKENLVTRFANSLTGISNDWEEIRIIQNIEAKVRTIEERLEDAKANIEQHKAQNTWIEEILTNQ